MLVTLSVLPFRKNLGISLLISTNNLLGFWLGLCLIYRSIWEDLTLWQHWVFLSMNMEYLFIYLVLTFYSLRFCSFSHIHIIHILLDLYLSTSFWGWLIQMLLHFKFPCLPVYCWYIESNWLIYFVSYNPFIIAY